MNPEICPYRGKPVYLAYEGLTKHACNNPAVGLVFCENAIRLGYCPRVDEEDKESDGK